MTRRDADALIAFLRENLVSVMFSRPEAGVHGMELVRTEPGKYKLVAGEQFDAYWCPYAADSVHAVTLSDAADRMFTATMNGCSFGVGIAAPDGAVRVAHANSTEVKALEDFQTETIGMLKPPGRENTAYNNQVLNSRGFQQGALKQQLQLAQLKSLLAESGDRLSNHISRAAYNGCTSITTFGLRVGSAWEFWFQGNIDGAVCGCFPFPMVNPG